MDIEVLTHIINEWDPVKLISFSPQDEYLFEIKKIQEILLTCDKDDTEFLANEIFKIFTNSFGSNVFTSKFDECVNIAKKILDIYAKTNSNKLDFK